MVTRKDLKVIQEVPGSCSCWIGLKPLHFLRVSSSARFCTITMISYRVSTVFPIVISLENRLGLLLAENRCLEGHIFCSSHLFEEILVSEDLPYLGEVLLSMKGASGSISLTSQACRSLQDSVHPKNHFSTTFHHNFSLSTFATTSAFHFLQAY